MIAMTRPCNEADFEAIWRVIDEGARAYRGIIPADCLRDPYMSREKLQDEIDHGVLFWGVEHQGMLSGVMGIQNVKDVTLVRHAYVRTEERRSGIGSLLLSQLQTLTDRPILVGTWADAVWAIHFYEKHGFALVSEDEKRELLQRYWTVPERQIETSVVLRRFGNEGKTIQA